MAALKNWSLIYRDTRTPALAPIYDYLCTSVYAISGRNELALNLGGVRAFAVVNDDVFDRFARRADVSPRIVLSAAHEMRDRILTKWPETRELILASSSSWSSASTMCCQPSHFLGLESEPIIPESDRPLALQENDVRGASKSSDTTISRFSKSSRAIPNVRGAGSGHGKMRATGTPFLVTKISCPAATSSISAEK